MTPLPPELNVINSPLDLVRMEKREAMQLFDWIVSRLAPAPSGSENSYCLKHVLQRETGLYVTNGQFKGAMLLLHWLPNNWDEVNWSYRLFVLPRGFDEETP